MTKKVQAMISKLARRGEELLWKVGTGAGYSDGSTSWSDHTTGGFVRFERDGIVIVLNVDTPADDWSRESAFEKLLVEGHTLYDGRCFTRFGVDTSSCRLSSNQKDLGYEHCYPNLDALLAGEHARCVAARERVKTAVPVPGLPFHVQPEWFTKTATALRLKLSVQLLPHGMGTGYMLSTRARGGKRASADLESKLGVGPVYVEQFDHD